MQLLIRAAISGSMIAVVSLLSRRMPLLGAIIVSLPINSILAMVWLYEDTKDTNLVISLSQSIFWIILPSSIFFLAMTFFLRRQQGFYPSLALASVVMIGAYWLYVRLMALFGVRA